MDFFDGVPETYGIDEEGLSAQEESGGVEIPPIRVNLTSDQLSELQSRVLLPFSESNNFGIDLYVRALEFLQCPNLLVAMFWKLTMRW